MNFFISFDEVVSAMAWEYLTKHWTQGESLSRVDQIDGAINHIKNLETKVKIAEKHRESLRERKRSRSGCSSSSETRKVEVHEMGSFLRITLVCDYEDQFILREIIRMLNEDNIEVKSVHSSLTSAISSLHVLNAEVWTVLPRIPYISLQNQLLFLVLCRFSNPIT